LYHRQSPSFRSAATTTTAAATAAADDDDDVVSDTFTRSVEVLLTEVWDKGRGLVEGRIASLDEVRDFCKVRLCILRSFSTFIFIPSSRLFSIIFCLARNPLQSRHQI
jgi:hypothetical protein